MLKEKPKPASRCIANANNPKLCYDYCNRVDCKRLGESVDDYKG